MPGAQQPSQIFLCRLWDTSATDRVFGDDIQWHDAGTSSLNGDYRGKEAVFAYFGKLMELTEGTFHQEIHAILADDDHVVVLTDNGYDKPKPFTGHKVLGWHVRDGKAVECWDIPADQAGAAASLG